MTRSESLNQTELTNLDNYRQPGAARNYKTLSTGALEVLSLLNALEGVAETKTSNLLI